MSPDLAEAPPVRLRDGLRLSAEQFTVSDNKGFELVYGVVREKPVSSFSDHFQYWLGFLLGMAIRKHGGVPSGPEGGFQCFDDPDLIRKPDITWTSRAEFHKTGRRGWRRTPPTFAIEVLSPRNTRADIQEKVDLFLGAGTQMIWVVDPVALTAIVHTADGQTEYGASDVLPCPLETFRITLGEVNTEASREWNAAGGESDDASEATDEETR